MFILAVVVLFCIWFSYSKKNTALEQEIKVVNNLVMAEAIILAAKEANKTPEEKKQEEMATAIKKIMKEDDRKRWLYEVEYAKKSEATLLSQGFKKVNGEWKKPAKSSSNFGKSMFSNKKLADFINQR